VSEDDRDIFSATYYFSWAFLVLFGVVSVAMCGFGLFISMARP
jgi:hypothetical protein